MVLTLLSVLAAHVPALPLTASRCVAFAPYAVQAGAGPDFERGVRSSTISALPSDSTFLLLRRRNDVSMYGRLFNEYPDGTPDYVALRVFSDGEAASAESPAADEQTAVSGFATGEPSMWDATLVQRPSERVITLQADTPCFLAMNRFPVREDCALRFEERWATRTSRLSSQSGFIGFSLLRKCSPTAVDSAAAGASFTYSTATLWASEDAWLAWREGEGKNSHDASRELQRTPVSDWLDGSASPIFWDVPIFVQDGEVRVECGSDASEESGRTAAAWDAMRNELEAYRAQWGNADAPLNTPLGRWCATQRRLYAKDKGALSAERVQSLNDLGFSWTSPSDVDDPLGEGLDWEDLCNRLANYCAEHEGDADVPKKYKPDPVLGGWVAAVRRNPASLGEARIAQLNDLGFLWKSKRQCGSAFMKSYRELCAFHAEHGHVRVDEILGEGHELARWCVAVRRQLREGSLSPKRVAYLRELGISA